MANISFTVELMTIDDYEEVVCLWQKTEGVGLNESDSKENITSYLLRNSELSFVARSEGKIVGAVLCGHDGRRGYLHHLAVAPSHRQKGIAKLLVGRCLDGLKKIGIPKCNIFVYADNDDGKSFWRHNGWVDRNDLGVLQKVI